MHGLLDHVDTEARPLLFRCSSFSNPFTRRECNLLPFREGVRVPGVQTAEACGDRVFLDSGPAGAKLRIAVENREGFQIAIPVVDALLAELMKRQINVLVIDPVVSSHGVSENDNGAINAVVKTWARIAKRAGCSVVLVHHTKKLGGEKVTAEASRGAGSLIAAARVTLVFNRMDKDEAQRSEYWLTRSGNGYSPCRMTRPIARPPKTRSGSDWRRRTSPTQWGRMTLTAKKATTWVW